MSLFELLESIAHLGQPCPVTGIKRGDCDCSICMMTFGGPPHTSLPDTARLTDSVMARINEAQALVDGDPGDYDRREVAHA